MPEPIPREDWNTIVIGSDDDNDDSLMEVAKEDTKNLSQLASLSLTVRFPKKVQYE